MSHAFKTAILILVVLTLNGALSACRTAHPERTAPDIFFSHVDLEGGATLLEDKSIALEWPGSGIRFSATGPHVRLRFNNRGDNRIRVDTVETSELIDLREGISRVELEKPAGLNEVRIRRLNDPRAGALTLMGVEPFELLRAPHARDRGILILGDSISVGYGVDGPDRTCRFSYDTENNSRSYGALTADAFDADVTTIAVSGRGLVRNWGNTAEPTIPEIWREASASLSFPPDLVIVINLGTNDFNGHHPGGEFVSTYVELIADLRQNYPAAHLYAATGPMLPPDARANLDRAVEVAIAQAKKGKGIQVGRISFSFAASGRVYGCDWHPGQQTHTDMAQKLIQQLSTDLGWHSEDVS